MPVAFHMAMLPISGEADEEKIPKKKKQAEFIPGLYFAKPLLLFNLARLFFLSSTPSLFPPSLNSPPLSVMREGDQKVPFFVDSLKA